MIVRRIQVEEGFLDGLDLYFAEGLNVLIGPRGSGKTSVIELIRFCLGARALTEKASQSSREHALSILGSGRVTVTASAGVEEFTFSRSADHWTRSVTTELLPPLVMSQNEIEAVGLDASGRLRLLDRIRPPSTHKRASAQEELLLSRIRSQTEERRTVSTELQTVRNQLREVAEQVAQAETLKKQHADALSSIAKATKQTATLQALSTRLAAYSVRSGVYKRTRERLQQMQARLQAVAGIEMDLEDWPTAADSPDPLAPIRNVVAEGRANITAALQRVTDALNQLTSLEAANNQLLLKDEDEARAIRRELETLQKGAGEAARRLAILQEKVGQQSALRALEKSKEARLEEIQRERKGYLDELEAVRTIRFEQRAELASQLNVELGPQIRISVERAGLNSEYASAIVSALRGSGLRFNEVAPIIADHMSPREFVEAIENEDIETLADITGITPVRAAKIIERVNDQGVEDILTAPVEDGVSFALLDGVEYKTSEDLSTGQRCTIVLSLLLKQRELSLAVDQPEDHLDNAFIADTLIKAMQQRKGEGQMIFSTHNANIPVLGDANLVVLLGSDGSRGFVRHADRLDAPQTVHAITTVMEGGIEAFQRRARFYHATHDDGTSRGA
jgi:molybdopterin-guanine dinucleotide biosynthesis protein